MESANPNEQSHVWRLLALLVHGGGANLNSRGRHFQRTTRALGMSVSSVTLVASFNFFLNKNWYIYTIQDALRRPHKLNLTLSNQIAQREVDTRGPQHGTPRLIGLDSVGQAAWRMARRGE